jgi:hypothetical protein
MNETTETVTLLPTVRIHRTRFFEADVWEGDFPRDDTRSEDFDFDVEDAIEGAVRLIQREGLTFSATGRDYAANPDGTVIIDYGTAQREEVSAHLIGFTDEQVVAIIEQVG